MIILKVIGNVTTSNDVEYMYHDDGTDTLYAASSSAEAIFAPLITLS